MFEASFITKPLEIVFSVSTSDTLYPVGITAIFLDESEAKLVFDDDNYSRYDIDEIVITNASEGSRIICGNEITGCGDTYMAAYILKRLLLDSPEEAGEFASLIASEKLMSFGPYKFLI